MIERDDMPEEFRNIFSIEATNNTGKENLFNSGVFTLIKGRHIEKDDREKIIIHEELAQKNNLELNDKIRLELFDLNNNEIKTEYEYEIIGIFSGKKQEKYTGMTSDFSENMVFIDYESSQVALNKAENNKVVNKLEIFSDSPKDTNIVLNKIKEIKIDWSKFNIEKDDDVYEETLESVEGIKHIIKVMTYLIMTGGIIVLSLILILWLRERIYEIGNRYPDIALALLGNAFSNAVFENKNTLNIKNVYDAIKNTKSVYDDAKRKGLVEFKNEFKDIIKEENVVLD